jgi:hypothetical protein
MRLRGGRGLVCPHIIAGNAATATKSFTANNYATTFGRGEKSGSPSSKEPAIELLVLAMQLTRTLQEDQPSHSVHLV